MALLPDYGRKVFSEENVDIPAGLKTSAAYDLTLYHELGQQNRGVLVVKFIGSFAFKEGKKADGTALAWTGAEKATFMAGFRTAVPQVWAEKHRITTASTVPLLKDVGVIFDVQAQESMSVFSHSHWNVAVTKVDKFTTSTVAGQGGGFAWNGDANLDSQDLNGVNKGGPTTQRACVHEFGHMMGYRDEYTNNAGAAEDNPNWLADLGSVMNVSEGVRPRHYVFLADWLTKKYAYIAHLASKPINWKVNGSIDLSNAQI